MQCSRHERGQVRLFRRRSAGGGGGGLGSGAGPSPGRWGWTAGGGQFWKYCRSPEARGAGFWPATWRTGLGCRWPAADRGGQSRASGRLRGHRPDRAGRRRWGADSAARAPLRWIEHLCERGSGGAGWRRLAGRVRRRAASTSRGEGGRRYVRAMSGRIAQHSDPGAAWRWWASWCGSRMSDYQLTPTTPLEPGRGGPGRASTPDRTTYIRDHAWLAGRWRCSRGWAILWLMGNPYYLERGPWAGSPASCVAGGMSCLERTCRAVGSDDRRLLGPGCGKVPLAKDRQGAGDRKSAVQVITIEGDKHLIRYQADPGRTRAANRGGAGRGAG